MRVYLPIFPDENDQPDLSLIREGKDLALLRSLVDPSIELLIGSRIPNPADYELLVTGRPKPEYLSASEHLKTLLIPFAGLPEPTRELLGTFPQISTHNLHFNADETTEMALALLLSAAKKIVPIDQRLRRGNWEARYEQPSASELLCNQNALVLGYGAIGQRLARVLSAMGMKCTALKRSSQMTRNENGITIETIEMLDSLLPHANVLIIALPLTSETVGLIGSEQISLLPDHAIVVNIGRAKIIDEIALFQELKTGRIRAGLDVWYQYPDGKRGVKSTKPSQFDFEKLDNVVMSPHRGGHSREMQDRRMQAIAEFINLAYAGKTLPNKIDLTLGY